MTEAVQLFAGMEQHDGATNVLAGVPSAASSQATAAHVAAGACRCRRFSISSQQLKDDKVGLQLGIQ